MHHQARRCAQLGRAVAGQRSPVTFGAQPEDGLEYDKRGQQGQQRRQEHKRGCQKSKNSEVSAGQKFDF